MALQSPVSHSRIRGMQINDFIIAYQAGIGIVALARVNSGGYRSRGSDAFDSFDLALAGLQLANPIPLKAVQLLPNAKETFEFVRATQGTVFEVGEVILLRDLLPNGQSGRRRALSVAHRTRREAAASTRGHIPGVQQ